MGTYYKKMGNWFWLVETPAHGDGEWYDKGDLIYPPNPPYGPYTPTGNSMAYDSNRRVIVYQEKPNYYYYPGNTTWEYTLDTNTWARVPFAGPSPGNATGKNPMCYDGVNKVVVMLESRYGTPFIWRWDGALWYDFTANMTGDWPVGCYGYSDITYSLVWDESRQKIWFYSNGLYYIWSYTEIGLIDTSTFTYTRLYSNIPGAGEPPPRAGYGIAYDPVNEGLLLSHGYSLPGGVYSALSDTWLITETEGVIGFSEVAGPTVGGVYGVDYPESRSRCNMATGPHGVYMVSGYREYGGGKWYYEANDSWHWNGTGWSELDYTATMDQLHQNMLVVGKYPLPTSDPVTPEPPPTPPE